jgi:integrase
MSVAEKAKKSVPKSEYPKTIRSGPVVVKIYRTHQLQKESGRTYQVYTVAYTIGGRRQRYTTSNQKLAHEFARKKALEIEQGHVKSITLTGAEMESYRLVREMLVDDGLSLESIVKDFKAAYELVRPSTMTQVARAYVQNLVRPLETKSLEDIVAEFLKAKAGKSERHHQTLKNDTARFVAAFRKRELSSITASEIETWVKSLPGEARTKRNIIGSISNLFHYAQRKNYLSRQVKPEVDYVDRPTKALHRPAIFSVVQVRRLLENAPLRLIPPIVLMAFAGYRRSEVLRADWADVFGHERATAPANATIWADQAKTKKRRLPPLTPNCLAWLKPFADATGSVCPHPDRFTQITTLAKGLGLEWKHDILRDSFISCRLAVREDMAAVAMEAGNSPRIIQESYLDLQTKKHGEAYFEIFPPKGWPKDRT